MSADPNLPSALGASASEALPQRVSFLKIGVLARLETSMFSNEWERCIVALQSTRPQLYTFSWYDDSSTCSIESRLMQ
jgi:hypothetical protein